MSLEELAHELENEATLKGVDIFVDSTALKHNFIPVMNDKGKVGAIGNYLENNRLRTGFFLLNENIVKYGLNEGFDIDDLFDSFKDKIFTEINKEEFFEIMLHK